MAREIQESHVTDRRDFLRRVSGTLAVSGMALAGTAVAETPASPAVPAPLLPTIALGSYRVTRMITGWNPIGGTSHQSLNASRHMMEYWTVDRVVDFLLKCEQAGVNTWQLDHDERATATVRKLREKGSKLQFFCLHCDADAPLKTALADLGVFGFSHHGGATDGLFRAGKAQVVHDYVKKVHDLGLLAGISAHCPDHIKRIADEDWENDFFMTCFYHVSRPAKDQKELFGGRVVVGEPFFDQDPVEMTKVVRSIPKPCLGFKILAAGRVCKNEKTAKQSVEKAFQFAFANIKPIDAVIVGMFPVYYDELSDNVAYVRKYGAAKTG